MKEASTSDEQPYSVRRRSAQTASERLPRPNNVCSGCEKQASIIPRLVAGSIGSIITAVAVTPLEVVKVRQQQATLPSVAASRTTILPPNVVPCPKGCGTFVLNILGSDCVLPKSAVPYFNEQGVCRDRIAVSTSGSHKHLGTFGMLRKIFAQEGLSGIYAGLAPTLVMSVPNTVLYFTSYDEIVGRLRKRLNHPHAAHRPDSPTSATSNALNPSIPLVSGASARFIASTATAPLELIRTRQASLIGESKTAPGLWQEFRIIVKTEGAGALFTGLGPTLWRDVPFSAIYWFCVEQLKLMWKRHDGEQQPLSPARQAGQAFVNGGASGMIASCATTPFDVVKTRRQTGQQQTAASVLPKNNLTSSNTVRQQVVVCHHDGAAVYEPTTVGAAAADGASRPRNVGTLATMKEIVATEGMAGLWRGNQTRMIKVAPACAIMIACYELGKRMME